MKVQETRKAQAVKWKHKWCKTDPQVSTANSRSTENVTARVVTLLAPEPFHTLGPSVFLAFLKEIGVKKHKPEFQKNRLETLQPRRGLMNSGERLSPYRNLLSSSRQGVALPTLLS